LPGSEAMPITDLRLASRALRAASRAAAASITFWMIERASPDFPRAIRHLVAHQAFERLAHFGADQLVLGLELNLGSGSLTETIAVRPSRMSSPVSVTFSASACPTCRRNC
jgi:hypothetical protein